MNKKKILSVLLVLILVLSAALSGCVKPTDNTEKFTITFESNGGTRVKPITAGVGESIRAPQEPTKQYYDFDKWYRNEDCTIPFEFGSMESKNFVLYAGWNPLENYLITFESNGGTPVKSIAYIPGTTLTPPEEPFKEYNEFLGWFTVDAPEESALFNFAAMPESDIKLYAQWKPHSFASAITLIANGEYVKTLYILRNTALDRLTEEDLFGSDAGYMLSNAGKWFTNAAMTTEYDFSAVVSTETLTLYTSYYSTGLTVEGNTVKKYNGASATVVVPAFVTTIEDYAFFNNSTVKNVIIHDGITSIGDYAFYGCTSLRSIGSWNASNTLLRVSSVGEYAFYGCSSLTSIRIGVETVEQFAFANCVRLQSVDFSDTLKVIGKYAFANNSALRSVSFPEALTDIGDYAFSGAGLTSFNVSKNVSAYGDGVLSGCLDIKSITVHEDNTAFVRDGGIYYNQSGTELIFYLGNEERVSVNAGVKKISNSAFLNNDTITSLTLPAELESGFGILNGIKNLSELTIASFDNIEFIAHYYGASSAIGNGVNSLFVSSTLKTVNLSNVTTIPQYAFYGCTYLEEINGLDTVSAIEEGAFAYTGIKSFKVTAGLSSIGENVFTGCSSLKAFTKEGTNSKFDVIDNCIFNKTDAILVRGYIDAGVYDFSSFPASLKIAHYALEFCKIGKVDFTVRAGNDYRVSNIGFGALRDTEIEEIIFDFGQVSNDFEYYYVDQQGNETRFTYTVNHFTSLFGRLNSLDYRNFTAQFKRITVKSEEMPVLGGDYEPLTVLPDNAFSGVSSDEFVLSDRYTTIGMMSFYESGIKSFPTAKNITRIESTAFAHSKLEVIDLPDSVKTISSNAFTGCAALREVNIGEDSDLTSIGSSAFMNCAMLTSFTFNSKLTTVGSSAFGNCEKLSEVTFAEGAVLKEFPSYMFYGTAFTSFTVPASVERLSGYVFADCDKLESVIFEENSLLTFIGTNAFAGDTRPGPIFKTITLPALLKTLDFGVFRNCLQLKEVIFAGNEVSTIGQGVFFNCAALETFVIPSAVKTIAEYTFEECVSLKSVVIHDAVLTIGNYAFFNCKSLEALNFGVNSALTKISEYAFASCIKIKNVFIPAKVVEIGMGVFSACDELVRITIGTQSDGGALKLVGRHAFNSRKVRQLIIYKSVTAVTDLVEFGYEPYTFETTLDYLKTIGAKVYVPDSYLTVYQSVTQEKNIFWHRVIDIVEPLSTLL